MVNELTQDQKDLVQVICERGGGRLSTWAAEQFRVGADFDSIELALSRASEAIRPWRIGRGV